MIRHAPGQRIPIPSTVRAASCSVAGFVVVATMTSHDVQQWMMRRPMAVGVVRLPWLVQRGMVGSLLFTSGPDVVGRAAMPAGTPFGSHIPLCVNTSINRPNTARIMAHLDAVVGSNGSVRP
jgi:hypothetical protein